MAVRTVIPDLVPEEATWRYTATLQDEAEAAVPLANMNTITLTLYNLSDGLDTIINAVNKLDILNANRGTFHATSGLLTITLLPADNAIVDATLDLEHHLMLIEFTYETTKQGAHEVELVIQNMNKRP